MSDEKYFKYDYHSGPEDHTERNYIEYTTLSSSFIGPFTLKETMIDNLSNILRDEIYKEFTREFLRSITKTDK